MMQWNEIIGHQDQVRQLRALVAADRIPHALLLVGPAGIGKSLVARLVAVGALCDGEDSPCGCCRACMMFGRGANPDFTLVKPDGRTIKIDQIRALQHFAALMPAVSQRRVCIIEDAEAMTVQAANSLLKLLEEPPAALIFILVAGTSQPLLPTVLSRCRKIQFQPLSVATLAEALATKEYAPEIAQVAARLSGGRMGTALNLLAPDGFAARGWAIELLDSVLGGERASVWDKALQLDSLESKAVMEVLEFLIYLFRDIVIFAGRHSHQLLYNIDLASKLARWAEKCSEDQGIKAVGMIKNSVRAIGGNANTRLTLEALLINLKDLIEKGD